MFTSTRPYHGLWIIRLDGKAIGTVNGDAVIGFRAARTDGTTVSRERFESSDAAMSALVGQS